MTAKDPAVTDFERVKADRQNWEDLWQDIAELVLPRRDFVVKRKKGEPRHNRVFDATAIRANSALAAGLQSFLINPRTKWFELRVQDEELNQNDQVAQWLADVRDAMLAHFNSRESNFYPSVHEGFQDLSAFGTMAHFIAETNDGLPRFSARPMSEIFLREDDDGRVDTVYRLFELTAKQARDMYGLEALPRKIQKALEQGKHGETFEFLQAVFRNGQFDPQGPQARGNMRWTSRHFAMPKGELVRESGFRDFPFTVARWSKVPGEVYGRSPSMEALPDIRMLQRMSEVVIKAAQKVVDPPLMVPDDSFLHPIRTMPGGINYFRNDGRQQTGLQPIQTGGRIDVGDALIQQRQRAVQQAFLMPEIVGLVNRGDASPLKATEVVGRQTQALRQLAPILSRLQDEFLIPAIDRTFNIMFRNEMLPQPPEVLNDQESNVQFVSQAAVAQQASENDNILNWLQQILPIFDIDPRAAMNVDTDQFVRIAARSNNVPPEVLTDREVVRQQREQAQQQEQQAQFLETLQQAGAAAGTAGQAAEIINQVGRGGNGG